jgi:ankyrin repeat protein
MCAKKNNYNNICNYLIEKGYDNLKDEIEIDNFLNLKYLLIEYAYSGDLLKLKNLIETNENLNPDLVDYDNRSPLHLACEAGNMNIVEYLVDECDCDINLLGI